jgi:hypothetical protein
VEEATCGERTSDDFKKVEAECFQKNLILKILKDQIDPSNNLREVHPTHAGCACKTLRRSPLGRKSRFGSPSAKNFGDNYSRRR